MFFTSLNGAYDYITLECTPKEIKVQQSAIFMKVIYFLSETVSDFSPPLSSLWRADNGLLCCQRLFKDVVVQSKKSWESFSWNGFLLSQRLHSFGKMHVSSLRMQIHKYFVHSSRVLADANSSKQPQKGRQRTFLPHFCQRCPRFGLIRSPTHSTLFDVSFFEFMTFFQVLILHCLYLWAVIRPHISPLVTQSSWVSCDAISVFDERFMPLPYFQTSFILTEDFWGFRGYDSRKILSNAVLRDVIRNRESRSR